jgi:integrase
MTPRKRKTTADNWLPPRVYRGKSSYEYRPKGGKCQTLIKLQRDDNGNVIEPVEVRRSVMDAYDRAVVEARPAKDVNYWLNKFMVSDKFISLNRLTQEDYRRYIEVAVNPNNPASKATHNGIRHVFGAMTPTNVKPTHIRRYMDYWNTPQTVTQSNGTILQGKAKPTTANRHLSCLQAFFKWLRQYLAGMEQNPADGLIKFQETARQVYITDEQYLQMLEAALNSTTPWFFGFIEIAYLCGLRRNEVCKLNLEDIIIEDGIEYLRIIRSKGSKGELIEISDRLQTAIDTAISLYPAGKIEPIRERPIIRNTRGDRISKSALQKALTNVKTATGITDVTLHDMKKKAGTDGKDLGHKTKRMADLYNLKLNKGTATR